MPKPNRAELAVLRGKQTPQSLQDWVAEFGRGDHQRAQRYALALQSFLGSGAQSGDPTERYVGTLSPHTKRAYAYAIAEFFEWLAKEHGRVVPPPDVTSVDVEKYALWLANRPYSLEREKLADGDQPLRLAIYDTVRGLGTAGVAMVAEALPMETRRQFFQLDEAGALKPSSVASLSAELGRMVLHDLLTRTPTLEMLRKEDPQLGITHFTVRVGSASLQLDHVYRYSVPEPRPVSRTTLVMRLTVLSSFWQTLAQGENTPGGEPILRYDVFRPILRRARRGLSAEQRDAGAAAKRLSPQTVTRLLEASEGFSLSERRDAALLWFMVLTGTRVQEVVSLRRGAPTARDENRWPGWFDASQEPPGVWLRRKGGKMQWLPFPPYALKTLFAFQTALAEQAAPDDAQSADPNADHYIHPDSARWRYRQLLAPDAPLFPPIHFWGANSTYNYQEFKPNLPNTRGGTDYRKPMTRAGVTKILHRLCIKAELPPEEKARVSPHSIRAFAATAMIQQGKPLREVQAILGHNSVTTTERYLVDEDRAVKLSGQNEILSYLATAVTLEPETEAPVVPPKARRVVDTYGVPATPDKPSKRPERRQERVPKASAPTPRTVADAILEVLPEAAAPDPSPARSPDVATPAVTIHALSEGKRLVQLADARDADDARPLEARGDVSPGSPVEVYEAMEDRDNDATRYVAQDPIQFTRLQPKSHPRGVGKAILATKDGKNLVQANKWLAEHYDPWPLHYGIGENSLLPWFARGNPDRNGEVLRSVADPESGKQRPVHVPPMPVFAPDQVYPETTSARVLFDEMERMTRDWMRTAPTKVFGLRRWYATFAYLTKRFTDATADKYPWIPFDGEGRVGKDVRAHEDEYLVQWLRENAGRFTTTVRLFKQEIKKPLKPDEAEALSFVDVFNRTAYESASTIEDIPEWFASEDPIYDIYAQTPHEWPYFLTWIKSVTGAKLTAGRKREREEQFEYANDKRQHDIDRAAELLDFYQETVRMIAEATDEGDEETAANYRAMLKGGQVLGKKIEGIDAELQRLGVADPQTVKNVPTWEERKALLLSQAFPDAPVELVDPNMLKSRLFDPDAFRIDETERTIRHTDEFRARFAEQFDGRDSECVMRRATRAMWEYVRRHNIEIERGKQRSTQYAMLYAVMLAYISWIVPCPEEIERTMAEHSGGQLHGDAARLAYVEAMQRAIRETLLGDVDRDEDEIIRDAEAHNLPAREAQRSMEIAALIAAEMAEHQVPVDKALADLEVAPGVVRRRRYKRNAGDTERRVVLAYGDEKPTTLFGVDRGGRRRKPDATPEVWLSPNVYRRGISYAANAEMALPSVLSMIAAMNQSAE